MFRSVAIAFAVSVLIVGVSGCGQNNPSDAPTLAYDNGRPDPPLPSDAGEPNPASEQSVSSVGDGASVYYPPSRSDLERDTLSNYAWQFNRNGVAGWEGWSGSRTFSSNGTYTDSNGHAGTWLLRGSGELLMADGSGEIYLGRLSGTNATGQGNREGVTSTFQMYR